MQHEEKSFSPLDNDALTRLIYLHDDEISQLLVRIRQLEERVRVLENQTEKQSKSSQLRKWIKEKPA